MISDPDIIRAAKLMIDQHGDHAAARANHRITELHFDGDIAASELWRQVSEAIEELQGSRRDDEPLN